jgi:hypothetical protein
MKIKYISLYFVLFISFLFVNSSSAQNNYDLNQFWNESLSFSQQPFHWQGNDWLTFGATTAATIAVMQADQSIKDEAMRDQSHINSFPIKAGKFYGEIYPAAIIAGGFGLYGYLADYKPAKKIAFETVQAVCYAGAVTTILKFVIGRARPYTDKGIASYKLFNFTDNSFYSMPSGHVTMAFSVSTVLANNVKSEWLKALCYVPAVATCVSRVYQNQHWTSDVLAGAAIGYFVGEWVSGNHETNEEQKVIFSPPFSLRIALF